MLMLFLGTRNFEDNKILDNIHIIKDLVSKSMKLIFYLVLLYYMITPSISWCLRTIFASSHKIKSVDFSPDG